MLALAFMAFVWYEYDQKIAIEYISAYLTEWSLSIDNIFVFILIFSFFGMKESYHSEGVVDRYTDGDCIPRDLYYCWYCAC